MRQLAKLFGSNDNIRTDHLKCDGCRTRVYLKHIVQSGCDEHRLFECAHCGRTKSLRLDSSRPTPRHLDNVLAFDPRSPDAHSRQD